MGYEIQFLTDDEMPEGYDFVLWTDNEEVILFYRQTAVCPQVLEDSWAAYRALERELAAA